jgi:PilZ domain-containing protein
MNSATEIRTLMVTRDSGLASTFGQISGEFGISAQRSSNGNGNIPEELGVGKYEALLIDFETVPQTVPILTVLRRSPANKNAVVFAVVGSDDSKRRARDQGATFLLERPLQGQEIRRVLQAAYGLMTRERRRYFRCLIEITVFLVRDSGEQAASKTINISSNGMAVSAPRSFEAGEKLHISFVLPGASSQTRARGTVVWDDKHGKTGLSLECVNPRMQTDLDAWLDGNFSQVLRKSN